MSWTFNGRRAPFRVDRSTGNLVVSMPSRGAPAGSLCVTIANVTGTARATVPAACPTLQALCGGGSASGSASCNAALLLVPGGNARGSCCGEGTISLGGGGKIGGGSGGANSAAFAGEGQGRRLVLWALRDSAGPPLLLGAGSVSSCMPTSIMHAVWGAPPKLLKLDSPV